MGLAESTRSQDRQSSRARVRTVPTHAQQGSPILVPSLSGHVTDATPWYSSLGSIGQAVASSHVPSRTSMPSDASISPHTLRLAISRPAPARQAIRTR